MFNKLLLLIVLCGFLVSCSKSKNHDSAVLSKSNKILSFVIPDDVRIPETSVFSFTDNEKKYLSFENFKENEIVIYSVESEELIKRISFAAEGDNSVSGGLGGYYISDMNHIFIPSSYIGTIYETDTTGIIKQQIDCSNTQSGLILIPFIPSYKSQFTFIGDNLYIPQSLNRTLQEKIITDSPVMAVIDTVSKVINELPMKFPPLISSKDIGTSAGGGCDYSECFNGNSFVYSFFYDDNIYIASPKDETVNKKILKSKYIDKIEVFKSGESDFQKMVKSQCEHASYGHIMYDKYRDVYYRFVYPSTEVDDYKGDYVNLIRSGGKQFSIMILDNKFNIMGETLFPEYTYNPKLSFILEDGLYISLNHIKNPDYSDDELRFQKIELKKK